VAYAQCDETTQSGCGNAALNENKAKIKGQIVRERQRESMRESERERERERDVNMGHQKRTHFVRPCR